MHPFGLMTAIVKVNDKYMLCMHLEKRYDLFWP